MNKTQDRTGSQLNVISIVAFNNITHCYISAGKYMVAVFFFHCKCPRNRRAFYNASSQDWLTHYQNVYGFFFSMFLKSKHLVFAIISIPKPLESGSVENQISWLTITWYSSIECLPLPCFPSEKCMLFACIFKSWETWRGDGWRKGKKSLESFSLLKLFVE